MGEKKRGYHLQIRKLKIYERREGFEPWLRDGKKEKGMSSLNQGIEDKDGKTEIQAMAEMHET